MSTLQKQIELQQQVVEKAKVNIVTCGQCGFLLLHEANAKTIKCYSCGLEDDISSFPDLFFSGMDNG